MRWNPNPETWAGDGINAWAGTTPVSGGLPRPKPPSALAFRPDGVVPAHALSKPGELPERKDAMKPFIPKQSKHARERIEAKLDERLVRRLERYCQYLESDRDYVLAQVLEVAFRKDRGFTAWLAAQVEPAPAKPERRET